MQIIHCVKMEVDVVTCQIMLKLLISNIFNKLDNEIQLMNERWKRML